jgi:hypothetical protein
MTEPYLTNDQLAARWGLQPAAIKNQRARGIGPKLLHHLAYRLPCWYTASAVSIIPSPGF